MRFAACIGVAIVCAVVLGGSANSARTDGGAAWTMQPVSVNQKWLRVSVQGEPLYGFHVRGTDFALTAIKRVLVSGGPAPSCAIRGTTQTTLECDGELPGGTSVFVNLEFATTGGVPAHNYEIALLFQPGDTNLLFVPASERSAPLRLGGTFGETSVSTGRITVHNPSTLSFRPIEVAPVGFRVTGISRVAIGTRNITPDCGITEGGGVACQGPLGPGKTATLTFSTGSFGAQPSVVLLAGDGPSAFVVAAAGNPCADIESSIAGLQAEANALQGEVAKLKRGVAVRAGALAKQIRGIRTQVAGLERRLASVRSALRKAQKQLRACLPQSQKGARVAACDPESKTAARTRGKAKGLAEALVVERSVSAKARPVVARLKNLGPRAGARWRTAVARLSGLVRLPQATSSALLEAQGVAIAADSSLGACETTLQQG